MKLFKNVDIEDIKAIMTDGVLPISVTGNNNWNSGNRANNSSDMVYLFNPTSDLNTFVQYGMLLLEVDVDGATKNEIMSTDVNEGSYEEFIISEVKPEQITAIYAPAIFKEQIQSFVNGLSVTYVEMTAEHYGEHDLVPADEDTLLQFRNTILGLSTNDFNYFRGLKDSGAVMDIYNVRYEI